MSDTIQNVTAVVRQDPNVSMAGKVNRDGETGKEAPPRADAAASANPDKQSAKPEVSFDKPGKISELVKDLDTMVHQVASTKISFDVDEDTGQSVVRVINKETGEVVRQVPPEELLTLAARMRQLSGLIFNQEA